MIALRHTARRYALLALMLLAACGGGETVVHVGVTRDTIGDTVVVRWDGPTQWGDSATLAEELRIGALDGPEEYTFGNIEGMTVDAAGRLYVLDRQVPTVRVYDTEGSHLRDMGREGGGPGEMRRPVNLRVLPDGRIVTRDEGNARFVLFTPNGQPAAEWRLPGGFSSGTPFTATRNGHLYTPIIAVRHEQGGWDLGLLHLDAAGMIVDTLAIPYEDYAEGELVAVQNGARVAYAAPFEPRSHWAMSPEGYIVAGIADRYAVDLFRPEGILRLARTLEPTPVHPDERSDRIESVTSRLRDMDPSWDWTGPATPDVKPAYAALAVDDEGRIWVRLNRPSTPESVTRPSPEPGEPERTVRVWRAPIVYDVWTADGELLGTVHMPDRFRPWVMRGDQVWGVQRDEDDVQYAVRYRIIG